MEQSSSWETRSNLCSQEIPHLLCNLKVHYCVHSTSSLVSVLSEINPFHNFATCFTKIHFNIILPSTSRFPNSLPLEFSYQNFFMHFSSLPCVLHALTISSSLTWSPSLHLVKRITKKKRSYIIFFVTSMLWWLNWGVWGGRSIYHACEKLEMDTTF